MKAGVASVPPKANETPPNEIVLFDNLSLVILPANCALVIVPVKLLVG